jgi:hypothetical protein
MIDFESHPQTMQLTKFRGAAWFHFFTPDLTVSANRAAMLLCV